MKTIFTTDTHLSHKNIIKGTSEWSNIDKCRPFDTVDEHDDFILDAINSVAGPEDRIIHGGDFSFGSHTNIPKFRDRIKCRNIFLVKGNHDKKLWQHYRSLFTWTGTMLDDLYIDKQHIVVCHYALQVWEDNNRGTWMIHGHSHNGLDHALDGKILDVCPEGHDYKPWTFEQIKEYMSIREVVAKDHHR
jgi:calcineurin-like phosphoesterase family protein